MFQIRFTTAAAVLLAACPFQAFAAPEDRPPQRPLRVDPPPIATDKSIRYDYDIVYVRAPRSVKGPRDRERQAMVWPDASEPFNMRASTDLMLLHPDGREEVLVAGAPGAIADPYVSFDAQWVYYTYFHNVTGGGGADVYKVHVKTRKPVRLTQQQWTLNTGAASLGVRSPDRVPTKGDFAPSKGGHATTEQTGVYNMHPCPLPGGRVAFVSNRDGFVSPRKGHHLAMQLFVMDDDGSNVEKIGHLNVGSALHPVILKDGRIIFSSLESQGLRDRTRWGIWGIHPDGTNWGPVVSAYENHSGGIIHFQTQLSDESIVVGNYYILAMGGFGTYLKFPARPPTDTPAFEPAWSQQKGWRMYMGRKLVGPMPFQPYGMEVLTHFIQAHDSPSLADPNDRNSHHVGRLTQPCGAPDNHLLTVWTGAFAPAGGRAGRPLGYPDEPPMDAGIYLIKEGRPIWEPGAMLLVKNDPRYNEQWPRPLVPYKRIYGIDEPRRLPGLRNDGKLSKYLPEGTPFGLIGTSSLYKRESYPNGVVPPGGVTATGGSYAVFPTAATVTNWTNQGADNGLYNNADIHAIRIVAQEPPSEATAGTFFNPAGERFRILGEFPVRKFQGDKQPLDPDGNPDTSFLARVPADVVWTFQTLDRHGMVLNMAQTWHQLRPGEVRNDCGGCHAHSQKPTLFKDTFAARSDYVPFDLTKSTPLLTDKQRDQSGKQWDVKNETGLRFAKGVLNVEYHRDIKPILERSCVACHSSKSEKPAGNLVLDDDQLREGRPVTYSTLLHAKGRKSEPYVWPFRSRNSLLTWKLFGKRIDGFPEKATSEKDSSYRNYLVRDGVPWKGFQGSIMPPPEAVAGTYEGPDGKKIKVAPLTDEDRRTIFRWIDLGCPVDLHASKNSQKLASGWMLDDQRPTLTLTYPRAGVNEPLTRLVVGMYDYSTGLDLDSFEVVADFSIDGVAAGANLAKKLRPLPDSRWELTLARPVTDLPRGKLNVSIKDRQGNVTRIERSFSVRP
jgi:hypothetical protein